MQLKRLIFLSLILAGTARAQLNPAPSSTGSITTNAANCNTTNACIILHMATSNVGYSVTVSGTWTGTLTVEQSGDNQGSWTSVTTTTANTLYTSALTPGITDVRVRGSAAMTGTAVVTITASGPATLQQITQTGGSGSGSATIKYASQLGAALNTNLQTGGGTDDTAKLQAFLMPGGSCPTGPIVLVMDGPALVSGSPAALSHCSNTWIQCLPGSQPSLTATTGQGGFFYASGGNGWVIANFNPSGSSITVTNVKISGCFINGNSGGTGRPNNALQQANHSYNPCIQAWGTSNMYLENNLTLNCAFTGISISGQNIFETNNRFEFFPHVDLNTGGTDLRGNTVAGGTSNVRIVNETVCAGDDAVAANTRNYGSSIVGPYIVGGPISHLTIDGMTADCPSAPWNWSGIDLISNNGFPMDDVSILHVRGNQQNYCVYINRDRFNTPVDNGTFGDILIDDANCTLMGPAFGAQIDTGLFPVDGAVSTLRLRNIRSAGIADPVIPNFTSNSWVGQFLTDYLNGSVTAGILTPTTFPPVPVENFQYPNGVLPTPWVPYTNNNSGVVGGVSSKQYTVISGSAGSTGGALYGNQPLPSGNQFSEVTAAVSGGDANSAIYALARVQVPITQPSGTYLVNDYTCLANNGNIVLRKNVAGAITNLQTVAQAITAGDKLRIYANVTTLQCLYNGAVIAQQTDATFSNGTVGLAAFTNNGTGTHGIVSKWTGGYMMPAQSPLFIANTGAPCTNAELVLSAGWQSTGSATVTAATGIGQTCSWTITTGTTTAANPTITDNLTVPLPSALTVCEINIHGGTHVGLAGEDFNQTTLSATAPIFTANFTPTAGGTTYFVTRRCGP